MPQIEQDEWAACVLFVLTLIYNMAHEAKCVDHVCAGEPATLRGCRANHALRSSGGLPQRVLGSRLYLCCSWVLFTPVALVLVSSLMAGPGRLWFGWLFDIFARVLGPLWLHGVPLCCPRTLGLFPDVGRVTSAAVLQWTSTEALSWPGSGAGTVPQSNVGIQGSVRGLP